MALVPWSFKNIHADVKHLERRSFVFGNAVIELEQSYSQQINREQNTGNVIWDGSYILARFIQDNLLLSTSVVVELGSGSGLGGLASAVLGANRVVLTDLDSQLPHLNANIERNKSVLSDNGAIIYSRSLDWTSSDAPEVILQRLELEKPPNIILASETVYLPSLHTAFVRCIQNMSDSNTRVAFSSHLKYPPAFTWSKEELEAIYSPTLVLVTYKRRGFGEEAVQSIAKAKGFYVFEVPRAWLDKEFQNDEQYVFQLWRRKI
ncbi:putative methyltransferase-domain-containing protein [Cladochytrium replicatum]|nr:putative methyltransferase-domain-containing protein [Cladochytrium replicatum]